jgi:hypothetical protein
MSMLLVELHRRGFNVRRDGADLVVSPSDVLTDDDRRRIRSLKGELQAALDAPYPCCICGRDALQEYEGLAYCDRHFPADSIRQAMHLAHRAYIDLGRTLDRMYDAEISARARGDHKLAEQIMGIYQTVQVGRYWQASARIDELCAQVDGPTFSQESVP